jgi:transposase
LFVLRWGIPWEMLPREMGCGSGMTCWRRLRDWQTAGVWEKVHRVLLARLRQADAIDFSRVIVDSSSIRAIGGGQKRDPTRPIARARAPSTTSRSMRKAFRSL